MYEVGDQLLAGAGFARDQHGGVRVGDIQCQFDRSAYCRCLADDLALSLVQFAAQSHHLGRELITFERSAELVGNTLDKRNVMVLEFAFLAPDKTEQPKRAARNMYRRDERGFAAKLRVKKES